MKTLFITVCMQVIFLLTAASCSTDDPGEVLLPVENPSEQQQPNDSDSGGSSGDNNEGTMSGNITIKVGNTSFAAVLEDNDAAKAFAAMLPMTVSMGEMNGNEKYYNLPKGLPTDAYRPGNIRAGDLLLWGATTLVIFYESFSSSYSYTRLGRIESPGRLADALGSRGVTVTFEITSSNN